MNNFSSKQTLFIVAMVMAGFTGLNLFIYQYIWGQIEPASIFIGTILSLVGSIVIILFVDHMVLRKISEILLTVRRNRNVKTTRSSAENTDDIEVLNDEIIAWTEERKNEIDRLKKLEDYRKEFLGNVSHELKTPIFNIQGYVFTLLDGGLEDETVNKDYLERAARSIDRMISIVEDLEAISQLETGELIIEPERFDITSLAKDIIDAEELRATTKGIMLSLPKEQKPVYVFADRFRIRQVLVNLIVNSIKYGKEYGETKLLFHDLGNIISIEVTDNGIGMTMEHLPRLFERFYRVDKGRSRHQGGTGLGLAIVKHIIEAHHQTIQVTSKVDVGTTFTFTLPKASNVNLSRDV